MHEPSPIVKPALSYLYSSSFYLNTGFKYLGNEKYNGTNFWYKSRDMGDILCPKCNSKDTEFDDLVTDDSGNMIAKCKCNACSHAWDMPFGL